MILRRFTVQAIPIIAIFVGVISAADTWGEEQPLSVRDAAKMITVRDVTVSGNRVSGSVVNTSPNAMQDVRLLIRQAWQWQKETRPGKVSPGRTLMYTMNDSIPAGGQAKFTFDVPPLPAAKGGTFKTTAEVGGFTELVPRTDLADQKN
jgi:hypothetical protein